MKRLTVAVINYNGMNTVLDTIESIYGIEGFRADVLVVDDGSTDGSAEAIRRAYPDIPVHKEAENTRAVNRLRNMALGLADTRYVLLTDNDVMFDSRCAVEMLRVMESDEEVAACLPRLMYSDDPSRVCFDGTKIHYLAATIAPTRDLHIEHTEERPTPAVGGGIALFDRDKLELVGGFDEVFELAWGDDAELHQRLLLAGYKCLYVPSAVGYHEFKPFDETRHYRARGQVRNRWHYMLTHYRWRTMLLIAPALILFEIAQAAFYTLKGFPLLYFRGIVDALRQLSSSMERRRVVQNLRTVPDRDLLSAGPLYIRPAGGYTGIVTSVAVKGLSIFFSAYWRLVRPALGGGHSSLKRREPDGSLKPGK